MKVIGEYGRYLMASFMVWLRLVASLVSLLTVVGAEGAECAFGIRCLIGWTV